MDLSVLIPARNEEWLGHTVADVLAHAKADTEVIVVLDGAWPSTPLPQHPRLQVVYLPQAIGQRAATNLAARLSTARYVMKLDAHCAVADGFDVALLEAARELGDDVTQVPAQFNLHVFDWVCACGARLYQGPTPTTCACGQPRYRKDVIWQPRQRRRTTAWRFDADLHFQYDGAQQKRQQGDLCDVMSCLGACWFLARDRYWQLGGLDEQHGSWGQMGTELACKAWLSGGRLVCNTRTWFAHLFRTQGGDFGFPYPITGGEQEAARQHSRAVWLRNGWPGQVRPLRWLVDHFWPVAGWTDAQRDALPDLPTVPAPRSAQATAGVVWYSDSRLDPTIATACRRQLRRAADSLPIVWVSLAPLPSLHASGEPPADKPPRPRGEASRVARAPSLNTRIVVPWDRGTLTMFRQILLGLERLDTDVVFFAEHDVLYAPEHFQYRPDGAAAYTYNIAVWKVDAVTGRAVKVDRCEQTSGLCADRALLLDHYRRRVAHVEAHGFRRQLGFEPGKAVRHGGLDDVPRVVWASARPNVDLRHGGNLTPSRWRPEEFRNARYAAGWTEATTVPGWGQTAGRMADFLREVS